jgi:G:T-mismatch repair DNA endonuclease (very short patch repair protein)
MNKTQSFILSANIVHSNKYDYSKTNYIKSKSKVTITCPLHGDFEQIPNAHLTGQGCPACGKLKKTESRKLKPDEVIAKCVETHGDRYDYSKIKYEKVADNVDIICKTHGLFSQSLINHYRGQGCPKCGKESAGQKQKLNNSEFMTMARKVHGDKYEYDLSSYTHYRSKVTVICKIHGPFLQSAENHYSAGAGCPSCAVRLSAPENEIASIIESEGLTVIRSDRSLIKPLEIDIVIPEKKIAIEYNGLKWHSEEFGKDKHYHSNKTKMCNDAGFRLVHIWENEWNENKDLQIRFIKQLLGLSDVKSVFARKCKIVTNPTKGIVAEFLNRNHIQGSCVYSESVCLYSGDELVSVSCFTRRGDNYELVRHCTSTSVIGSLGKSVKHFLRVTGKEVFTFLDKCRYSGDSYLKADFTVDSELAPDYSYVKQGNRYHKFLFRRKHIMSKLPHVYSDNKTEKEMMKEAGYSRLWDCGKIKFTIKP